MEPTIGIVVCGFTGNRQFVTNPYIQAVRYSKGLPVILPLVRSDRILDQYTGLCDGFLFCGGGDITPLLFGEEPKKGNGKTSITVDLFQIRLMKKILETGKPVFAICRGMQILSVACGGSIWQDMKLIPGGNVLDHMQQSASRSDISHRIRTEAPSVYRLRPLCKQLSPSVRQRSGKRHAGQRPGTGRHHRRHRTHRTSLCHRRSVAS